jgi:hypothetical protein
MVVLAAVAGTEEPRANFQTASAQSPSNTATLYFFIAGEAGVDVPTEVGLDNALIQIPELGITRRTTGGNAIIDGIIVSTDENCPTRVDVIISAEGYESFTYKNLPLFAGAGTVNLTPVLRHGPQIDDFTDSPRVLAGVECSAGLPNTGANRGGGTGQAWPPLAALAAAGLALLGAGGAVRLRRR